MASNLTEIGEALQNLNVTFQNLTTENIVPVAIQTSNDSSNGWVGLVVFGILCFSAMLHILKNKNKFGLLDKLGLSLFSLNIFIDVGIQLLIVGILESAQVFGFLYTVFFVVCLMSLLRKEFESAET